MATLFNREGIERKPNCEGTFQYQARCSRCGGAGGADKWTYTGWTCFECGGTGRGSIRTEKLYTAEKLAKLNEAKAKRDAAKAAERAAEEAKRAAEHAANEEAFLAANADFIAKLDTLEGDEFWTNFRVDFLRRQQEPSVRQIEAVNNEIAKREAIRNSAYVGEVGGKVELTLTCEKIVDVSWGSFPKIYCYLHICTDANGNAVVYKGAGNFLSEGETGTVRASVNEHSEYRGKKQTIIQRPKVVAA